MNSPRKKLLFLYLFIVLVKLILISFVVSPTIFGDEYTYAKLARSIFYTHDYSLHNIPIYSHPPLYSFLLSLAYLFSSSMDIVYFFMKSINAFISSLIIFSGYLLSRLFFDEHKSFLGAALFGILPFSFATTPYLMSENLFYPLFFFSLYFLMQALTTSKRYSIFLAGLFIGLTLLTREIGMVLLLLLGALFFRSLFHRQYSQLLNIIWIGTLALLPKILWGLRDYLVAKQTASYLVLSTLTINTWNAPFVALAATTILWIGIHFGYLVFATGILPVFFFNLFSRVTDEKKRLFRFITLVLVIFLVFIISRRAAGLPIKETIPLLGFVGRIIGRYIDLLIPLILLQAFISLQNNINIRRKLQFSFSYFTLLSFSFFLFGFLLFYFPLFPLNNISLTLYGIFKTGIEYVLTGNFTTDYISLLTSITAFVTLSLALFYLYFKKGQITFSFLYRYLLVFFILTSLASFTVTIYQSRIWDTDEQLQLGKHLDKTLPLDSTVLLDASYCGDRLSRGNVDFLCANSQRLTFVGFWLNRDIIIASQKNVKSGDYFITRENLAREPFFETSQGIFVYAL